MNSKMKSNKKTAMSPKAIVFWSIMGALVLALIILFIIRVAQRKNITSYSKVDSVQGQELYLQKEDSYYVLIYDFAPDEAMKDFDNTVFMYLTFYRDNKAKANKLYKFDITDRVNKMCLSDNTNLDGTSQFPSPNQKYGTETNVLEVLSDDLPILVLVQNGQITQSYEGTSAIQTQLNSDMKN